MALRTYNNFINAISQGFGNGNGEPFWDEVQTLTVSTPSGSALPIQRLGQSLVLPALPVGVAAYIVTRFLTQTSTTLISCMLAKLIDLGRLDFSGGAPGTFTDGSTMGTATVLGTASAARFSPVICEVTTAMNAAPGTFTITYIDQAGNTAETTAALTPGASAPVRSCGTVALNTGDLGVRDITAAATSAGTTPSGIIQFWGYIPLGFTIVQGANQGYIKNLLTTNCTAFRLGAADVLGCFAFGSTAVKAMVGWVTIVGEET